MHQRNTATSRDRVNSSSQKKDLGVTTGQRPSDGSVPRIPANGAYTHVNQAPVLLGSHPQSHAQHGAAMLPNTSGTIVPTRAIQVGVNLEPQHTNAHNILKDNKHTCAGDNIDTGMRNGEMRRGACASMCNDSISSVCNTSGISSNNNSSSSNNAQKRPTSSLFSGLLVRRNDPGRNLNANLGGTYTQGISGISQNSAVFTKGPGQNLARNAGDDSLRAIVASGLNMRVFEGNKLAGWCVCAYVGLCVCIDVYICRDEYY
jgi:hypothetical protein